MYKRRNIAEYFTRVYVIPDAQKAQGHPLLTIYITLVSQWAYRRNIGICDASPGKGEQGAVSIRKTVLPGMEIPMLKIRRPNGRLIFNMEIAIRR